MQYHDIELVDAMLDLPVEGYRDWLERGNSMRVVGYQPSADNNPVARYLDKAIGTFNKLHSDGKCAWFILRLTRTSAYDAYLRMMLPDWAGPLVMEYTAFPVGRVSSQPQEQAVTAAQARGDLRRLVEETHRHSEGGETQSSGQ